MRTIDRYILRQLAWPFSLGLTVFTFLLVWPILHALRVRRQGIDTETLKQRFYPATTIDTTKESIEWAKARLPLGPRS